MSLYLCVFADGRELDGIDIGSYGDFAALRLWLTDRLESHAPGRRFPTLILGPGASGEWPPQACAALKRELGEAASELSRLPPVDWPGDWQRGAATALGLAPKSALESFIDCDGEPMLARLRELASLAVSHGVPILFQ